MGESSDWRSKSSHPKSKDESGKGSEKSFSALQALNKQGIGIQQVVVPRDIVIPIGPEESVHLREGQTVMVIKTPKGIYLRMEDKIIKIKQPGAMQGLLGGPS